MSHTVSTHTVCQLREVWLVTEGGAVCVCALESGEFQGPNFFGNDFTPKVSLACCNGGFIAQRRFPLEPLVAEPTHLLVVGPVRSHSSSSVPPCPNFSISHFYFHFSRIGYYYYYYYLLQLSCHSVAVVTTLVQTKQIRINIHKRNNTKTQYK